MSKKFRGVIYTKTVIAEDNARTFYTAMSEAIEALEEAGQMYGWAQAQVSENDDIPKFDELTIEYK